MSLRNATLLVLVVALLVSLFAFPVNAVGTNSYDFPNFTEADSMAFVEEHNIEIPTKLQQSDYLSAFTRELILQSYESPDIPFLFNYFPTQEYAEDIREAVRMYIDLGAVPSTASATAYTLQYSKVMDSNGNWVVSGGDYNIKWLFYNCYAYSINRAEQPQYYSSEPYIQYQPGDMSGEGSFTDCTAIDQLVDIVCADLTDMGYSNISTSSTIPTINSSQELICVRMLRDVDYHFMRYDLATDAWYHKPSNTAVLKYNYTPSNSYTWNNERSIPGGELPATFEYDSDIVFITYSKNQINVGQHSISREAIQPNKDVFCELTFENLGGYDIQLTSAYSLEYEIYNEDFDAVLFGSGTSIDEYFAVTDSKYFLRVNFESNDEYHYVDICIGSHNHVYGNCTYVDNSYHTATCVCGDQQTLRHWVKQTGGRYANCVDCGALIDLGGTITPVNPFNIRKVTANGSYILPNGIAVIVDADVEAYINGTLVFYNPDELPVTQ